MKNKHYSEWNGMVSEPVETTVSEPVELKVSGVMDMLEQEFQVLTAIEQGKIIGGSGGTGSGGGDMGSGGNGDYVDSLLNGPDALFNTSGLTGTEKNTLRSSLINIENTNMGDTLLHVLQSTMALSSSGLISFSDAALSNGLSGKYHTGSHTIQLGTALSDGSLVDYNFVHELAHADLDANGEANLTVENEVEAYLVEGKFIEETGHTFNWGAPGEDGQATSTESNNFTNAANLIVDMGFNNQSFDTMCDNFKEGSWVNVGGAYDNCTDYDSDHPDSLPYVSILFEMDSMHNY